MARWWCGMRRALLLTNTFSSSSSSSTPSLSRVSLYHTIQAIPREHTGNRLSSKDRAQGRIPTIVFARDENGSTISQKHLLTTERKQINSLLKTLQPPFFLSTTFQLHIRAGAGSSHLLHSGTVLPVKLHRHPDTAEILNLVLVWAQPGSVMDVKVPVVFTGQELSPGISQGGHLSGARSLRFQGPIEHIPSKIEVDVSNLDIGDRKYVRDIEVHPSLKLLTKNEELALCRVVATKLKTLEPTEPFDV